jgi:pyruvate dehydrogenase E2 component (dihydrolipoamide acetyltransferase)
MALPSLSPTMTQGSIASWKKSAGDVLNVGDILCEIETDKASVGLEIQDEGVLAKILVDAMGPELAVGAPIALIVDTIEGYQEFQAMDPSAYAHLIGSGPATASSSSEPLQTTAATLSPESQAASPKQLSPAARHIVGTKSLDIGNMKGSGKGGKVITKADIIEALQSGAIRASSSEASSRLRQATAGPAPAVTSVPNTSSSGSTATAINPHYTDIPNSNMRKVIAKRLTESKSTVPHLYVSMDVNIDQVLALRKELKKAYEVNLSVNDLVIKSAAMALRDVPEAYAKWNPKTQSIEPGTTIDVSVAVATPTGKPLAVSAHAFDDLVPVLADLWM